MRDLTLCHRLVRRAADMRHRFGFESRTKLVGDVARTVIREQPGPMFDGHCIEARWASAISIAVATSLAFMVVHSFQAMT